MKALFQGLMLLVLIGCIVLNIITLRETNKRKEFAKHQAECRSNANQGYWHAATCGSCTPGLPPIPGTGGPGARR